MTVIVSMLRGINMGPHHRIQMEALRKVYEGLGLRDVASYVQSGNVVFRTTGRNPGKIGAQIEKGIEAAFGFHSDVLLRTTAELRAVVAANPFAGRTGIEPGKLSVTFLAAEPAAEAAEKLLSVRIEPEELYIRGREIFVYFPNGMARPKLPLGLIDRAVKMPNTGRNWNTVNKLLEMAEKLEA